jgi:acyl phosphate:glycerol-3-phosphate acyltransferase
MLNWVIAVVAGYLIGSIPFALLLARRRGIDIRRAGSGNVGATNVLRTVGARAAVVTLLLDAAKGVAAVVLARQLSDDVGVAVVAALAAIAGHAYPVWLGFHGGKGVATAAGAFSVLAPVALGIALMTFAITVWLTRFVSLGSMIGALMLVCVLFLTDSPLIVTGGAAIAAFAIIVGHRANLARLIAGKEHRLGRRQITGIGP